MKTIITAAIVFFAVNTASAELQATKVQWMSVTCNELQTIIQNNDLTFYGSYEYFNKSLATYPERTEFCQEWEKDHRVKAGSAGPVKTSDKRSLFNLCPIGRIAFDCESKLEN